MSESAAAAALLVAGVATFPPAGTDKPETAAAAALLAAGAAILPPEGADMSAGPVDPTSI